MKKLVAMLMLAAAMTSPMTAHADNDPAKLKEFKVSVIKVRSEPLPQKVGDKSWMLYRASFLVEVEAEDSFGMLTLSCTGFNHSQQPIGETRVLVKNVSAHDRVFSEDMKDWDEPATSVKCRVVSYYKD
jgi:hypothetical protein